MSLWGAEGMDLVNFCDLTEVTGLRMAASCCEVLHGDTAALSMRSAAGKMCSAPITHALSQDTGM